MAKRIMAFVLVAALALPFAVSCSGETGKENVKDTDSGGENREEGQNVEQAEVKVYPDLEPKDFGGYEFTFLTRTIQNVDWVEWDHRDLSSEELNGDIINDAVFNRNKKIEEKYNVAITESVVTDFAGTLRKTVRSGDDLYDIAVPHLMEVAALAQDGSITDIFQVPRFDFGKPWWNQNTPRDLSIGNKLFVMQGDLLIMDNDAMEAMIFNKSLLKDQALEDPYEIVKRGEWTFEKLYEMSRGVAQDLNGDGKMYIQDDRFGVILQADTDISFLVSGGDKICSKDSNDYPIITYGSDRSYRIADALMKLMLEEDSVVNLHRYAGKFGIYDEQVKMMEEDRALFSWIRMRIVERLRAMETDFGILPLPKLEKEQQNYITHMNPHTGAGISIPASSQDLDRTGMIIEDLCAESKYTLQPAYYEINLQGKFMRDDESREMLDIILANTAYDIGYIYNFGNFAMTVVYFGQDKKTSHASQFEKMEPKMQSDIEKTIEAYESVN
ncbi:MAG: hypothetical protein FWG34_03960 [Oscillospiraceae bacterium]|nr:hypothetical protein [Oscillospiraceae bacterium]